MQAEKQSRAKFELIRAEYDKTGKAELLEGLTSEEQAAAIQHRAANQHARRPTRPSASHSTTPRSAPGKPRSSLSSPLAQRSQRSSPLAGASNLMHT